MAIKRTAERQDRVDLFVEQVPVATSTHRFSDVARMDSGAIFSHSFWCCELNYTKMGIRLARNDENFVL